MVGCHDEVERCYLLGRNPWQYDLKAIVAVVDAVVGGERLTKEVMLFEAPSEAVEVLSANKNNLVIRHPGLRI